jgi:hypothetical protein
VTAVQVTIVRAVGLWGFALAVSLLGGTVWLLRWRFGPFRAEVLSLLRSRHPDIAMVRETPEGAILRVAGVEVRLEVVSLYRRWRGRARPDAVDGLAGAIRADLPPIRPQALTSVRPHLLPLIKPQSFIALYDHYPSAFRLAVRRFAEGLAIVYAAEAVHQITYVTGAMLEAWGLPADQLHAIALANLRRRTAHLLEELGGPQTVYEHLDGFEAARILVPELVTPPALQPALAAIPHEHLLLIAAADEAPRLAREAAAAHQGAKFPLSPAVFQLGEGSLAPLVLS